MNSNPTRGMHTRHENQELPRLFSNNLSAPRLVRTVSHDSGSALYNPASPVQAAFWSQSTVPLVGESRQGKPTPFASTQPAIVGIPVVPGDDPHTPPRNRHHPGDPGQDDRTVWGTIGPSNLSTPRAQRPRSKPIEDHDVIMMSPSPNSTPRANVSSEAMPYSDEASLLASSGLPAPPKLHTPMQDFYGGPRANALQRPSAPRARSNHYSFEKGGMRYSIPPGSDWDDLDEPPFGDVAQTSLLDIVQLPLCPHPEFYKPNKSPDPDEWDDSGAPNVLSGTKGITNKAVNYPKKRRITHVVYAPNMLDQFVEEAKTQLGALTFSWQDPKQQVAVAHVDPRSTQAFLPPVIHCEGDTVLWSWNSLVRPCLAVQAFTEADEISYDVLKSRKHRKLPWWTVGDQNTKDKCLPDGYLVTRRITHEKKDISAILEVKCDNVLRVRHEVIGKPRGVWRSMWSLIDYHRDKNFQPGYAMPFKWPFSTAQGDNGTLARVISQVVMEMGDNINIPSHVGPLAVLTSYDSTVFFVKKGEFLYISANYELTSNPLLAMYAFTCAATGAFKDKNISLDLPKPDITWLGNNWKNQLALELRSGIPRWALPNTAKVPIIY